MENEWSTRSTKGDGEWRSRCVVGGGWGGSGGGGALVKKGKWGKEKTLRMGKIYHRLEHPSLWSRCLLEITRPSCGHDVFSRPPAPLWSRSVLRTMHLLVKTMTHPVMTVCSRDHILRRYDVLS